MKNNKVNFIKRFNLQELYAKFLTLEPRQKILAIAALVIGVFLLFYLPINTIRSSIGELETQYQTLKRKQDRLVQNISKLETLKIQSAQIEAAIKKRRGQSLKTIVDQKATKAGIKDRFSSRRQENQTGSMPYYEMESVTATFRRLNIQELTDFLAGIESHQEFPLIVTDLDVRLMKSSQKLLRGQIKIETFKALKKD